MKKRLKCINSFKYSKNNNNKSINDNRVIQEKNIYEKNVEMPIIIPNELANRTSLFFRIHVAGLIESASVYNTFIIVL